MGLKTAAEYVESLRDDREIWYRGERVEDVTTHPTISKAVKHACIDYEMAESDEYRDLATYEEDGETHSAYYRIPRSTEDLLNRSKLIEAATAEGDTLVVLIKEIGTDALFALLAVTAEFEDQTYFERVKAFYEHCRANDLSLAVAQTDMKGDRLKRPSQQADPDMYLHVVERRPDGVVVRGAKAHTSVVTNTNEVIVLPTRAMGPDEQDWAIAFALPVNTPNLRFIASPFGDGVAHEGERPISAVRKMMETITIFDDVFVPNERIFLNGDADAAGQLALTFVEYHRFTAVSYKLPLIDALGGCAALAADYNGILGVTHVREKFIDLIGYAETTRALLEKSAERCIAKPNGQVAPDPMTVNLAKSIFAHGYHEAVQHVQEIAGGILVTGPGDEDWESEELRPFLQKYLAGRDGIDGAKRMKLLNFIRDLTSSDYGAYQEVLAIHAEGSLQAERLQIFRAFNENGGARRVMRLAGRMAGVR